MNDSTKTVKYIDGPDEIMRFMSIFDKSDISIYVESGFYYDDLRTKPFFITYIPLGFGKYIRIHRDFDDSSVHPSQGRGFCGFDLRSSSSVEVPIMGDEDVFREIIYLLYEQIVHPKEEQVQVIIDGVHYMASDEYPGNYKRIRDIWKMKKEE